MLTSHYNATSHRRERPPDFLSPCFSLTHSGFSDTYRGALCPTLGYRSHTSPHSQGWEESQACKGATRMPRWHWGQR